MPAPRTSAPRRSQFSPGKPRVLLGPHLWNTPESQCRPRPRRLCHRLPVGMAPAALPAPWGWHAAGAPGDVHQTTCPRWPQLCRTFWGILSHLSGPMVCRCPQGLVLSPTSITTVCLCPRPLLAAMEGTGGHRCCPQWAQHQLPGSQHSVSAAVWPALTAVGFP